MDQPTAIICLDLDGTSVENDGTHVWLSEPVVDLLNEAGSRGMAWCPNSGRTAENQFGMILACRQLEHMPFAFLSGERYVHDLHQSRVGLVPRQPLCHEARCKARSLATRVQGVVGPHVADLATRFPTTEFHPREEFVAWLLEDDAEVADLITAVEGLLDPVPDFQILNNGRWVVATHVDFGKGRVLTAAAEPLGVPPERILAIGDQPNDLDMLTGRAAHHVGCPSDAAERVQETVRSAGGIIASQPETAGTCEILRAFLERNWESGDR